ncbi:MAG: DNA recombination protein RmuC [Planctomycetia bacterium]|nr:DNA recombination protein RmuC [Planctomycetia bacterium]
MFETLVLGLLVLLLLTGTGFVFWFSFTLKKEQEALHHHLHEEFSLKRQEELEKSAQQRLETQGLIQQLSDTLQQHIISLSTMQETRLQGLTQTLEKQLENVRSDSTRKLEEIRLTVDEKLNDTLEKRLGESFRMVSERLEQLHHGLGEMQTLAHGVGDLKKILSNIKSRGTWGEVQLGNILEQMFSPDQYIRNAATKPNSQERVEYALLLPGQDEEQKKVLLPIDAKFPKEDYERIVQASEEGNAAVLEEAVKSLTQRIKEEGRKIRDKYVNPPVTTPFAILFLPTEGLYAEILRQPGLADYLQRECRVLAAGPTTLMALLNSLQVGFQTLTIRKQTHEIWQLLNQVRKKFQHFANHFEKVQKKMEEAGNTLGTMREETRILGNHLEKLDKISMEEWKSEKKEELFPPHER